jgi:hypothetical protein
MKIAEALASQKFWVFRGFVFQQVYFQCDAVAERVFIGDWLLRNLFLDKPARTALGFWG